MRLITLEPSSDRTCLHGDIIVDNIGMEGEETFSLSIAQSPSQDRVVIGRDMSNIRIVDDSGMSIE